MQVTETKELFFFDQLIFAENFCNFAKEKEKIKSCINHSECLKLYGPRNFGKTSLVKNIIAKEWEAKEPEKRLVVYADFYSVTSLQDISLELTKAFNKAIGPKYNLIDKSFAWLKLLKKVRPLWSPDLSGNGLGEFSLTTEKSEHIVDFEIILENIHNLQKSGKFNFLIILDEFQEIYKVKKAEALLRGALQLFELKIPIVILGSKQHLLKNIFENPRAPFYSWGSTIEFHPIAYEEYHQYIEERFQKIKKTHSLETSIFLQKKLNHIPESINRFCAYLCRDEKNSIITPQIIEKKMEDFIDSTRSIYENIYSTFTSSERKILNVIAQKGEAQNVLGKDFLLEVKGVSKSGVSKIMLTLLNQSFLSMKFSKESEIIYWMTDPFLSFFIKKHKQV